MGALIDLEAKYVNSYFGDVSTIVWFEVTPNNGPFSLEFRVERSRESTQIIQATNPNNGNAVVWQKQYEASSNPQIVRDYVTIWHNPQTNSEVYSIQNI